MIQGVYAKAIHGDLLSRWRSDIEAMAPRKREKWHDSKGRDENGVRQLVRYRNGNFQIRAHCTPASHGVHMPVSGWAPVNAIGEVLSRQQFIDTYGLEDVQRIESINRCPIDQSPYHVDHPHIREARLRGDLMDVNNAVWPLIEQNHTGNHYRNKTIAIPTAAGEPVRG